MLLGALVSTAAGTLFWHYLLQALPIYQSWGFSTLFSAIVSFTLVSSELHRHLDNEVISSSIIADHFIDMAGREDARDKAIERFGEKHDEALEKALDHNTIGEIADYTAQKTLDEVFKGEGQIPLHIQREREARRIAAETEAKRTDQQMEIVRDARPKDEKERPGLLDRAKGLFRQADPANLAVLFRLSVWRRVLFPFAGQYAWLRFQQRCAWLRARVGYATVSDLRL